MKKKLRIDDSIALSNAERVKNNLERINDKKHLAELLTDNDVEKESLYMRLYRAEKNGFINENEDLIKKLTSFLGVDRSFMVSDI